MKNRIIEKWNYLLAGFLGFWGLAFMALPGLVTVYVYGGIKERHPTDMYELIRFNISRSISIAAIFQIFMIIISIALLVLCIVQVLKLHGVKIPYLDKIYEKKIMKKYDIATLLVACYVLLSFFVILCFASFAKGHSEIRIGFGSVWLFLSSSAILLAIIFKNKLLKFIQAKALLISNKKKTTTIKEVQTKTELKAEKKVVKEKAAKKEPEESKVETETVKGDAKAKSPSKPKSVKEDIKAKTPAKPKTTTVEPKKEIPLKQKSEIIDTKTLPKEEK